MKRIEELTAKEKYEILLWADKYSISEYLCFKIDDGLISNNCRRCLMYEIQVYFNMSIIKPKNKDAFWWIHGSPLRKKAWEKLIEYWKHEAEKES